MRSQGLSKCFIILAFLLFVGAGIAEARKEIRIVGSVAVLPFMESIAENFALHWDYPPPSIEDTGTGRAFRLFGAGAGYQYPDMVVTPRPITPAEWAFCQKHGVSKVTEIIIGYDAVAFVNLKTSPRLNVTVPQLFNAMAEHIEQDGRIISNPYTRWHEIDPHLPEIPIRIMGPPLGSPINDAVIQLVMIEGCTHFPAIQALDPTQRFRTCRMFRSPSSVFREGLKHEAQIVQWLSRHREAFAFLHYATYRDYSDEIAANRINGVSPSLGAISAKDYPLSRPIYLYVKSSHVSAIPGLQQFLYEATSERAIGPDGYLAKKGFGPLDHRGRNHARDLALSLPTMTRP